MSSLISHCNFHHHNSSFPDDIEYFALADDEKAVLGGRTHLSVLETILQNTIHECSWLTGWTLSLKQIRLVPALHEPSVVAAVHVSTINIPAVVCASGTIIIAMLLNSPQDNQGIFPT